jgi:hypothetical protein
MYSNKVLKAIEWHNRLGKGHHGNNLAIAALVGWAKRSVPTFGIRVGTLLFAHPTALLEAQ